MPGFPCQPRLAPAAKVVESKSPLTSPPTAGRAGISTTDTSSIALSASVPSGDRVEAANATVVRAVAATKEYE